MMKNYDELILNSTFEDRLNYLLLHQYPGEETFAHMRYLNQRFYKSREWLSVRDQVIMRDDGNDLGVYGRPIFGKVLIHHMNPITPKILLHSIEEALDPSTLITVSFETHQAIHFGTLKERFVVHERKPGDTKLWSRLF